jgi:hypoxanthine phosphoribosyltransferase
MQGKSSKSSARRPRTRPRTPDVADGNLRCVYSEKQIQKRVGELARQIDRDYQGRTLHVVGILEDGFMFMADLVRRLTIPVVCHFMKAEITDLSAGGTPEREIVYTPKVEAAGRDVLLVTGIVQSGLTLDHLYGYVLARNPSSVRTASLIEKSDERKVDVSTDYLCFRSKGKFLVGYGLGYQEKYRNLPFVARLARAG